MTALDIIVVQPSDAERLKHIAIAAKSYWGYSEQLIAQWAQTPIITPQAIATDMVYGARMHDLLIGWYRLRAALPASVLEDVWVLPDYIGQGIGRQLFRHALHQAKHAGAEYLELEADPHAEPFYTKMGCQRVGERLSEWGRLIPHMIYHLV